MGSGDSYSMCLKRDCFWLDAPRPSATVRHSWQRGRSTSNKSLGEVYWYTYTGNSLFAPSPPPPPRLYPGVTRYYEDVASCCTLPLMHAGDCQPVARLMT